MLLEFRMKSTPEGAEVTVNGRTLLFAGVTTSQLQHGVYLYYTHSFLVQDAFPYLTPNQREFLMTGLFPEEFAALCGPDD
jgi:hypothetical protein